MMAAVANKIVAAPFAYIGSIGVMASLVNAHKAITKLGEGGLEGFAWGLLRAPRFANEAVGPPSLSTQDCG